MLRLDNRRKSKEESWKEMLNLGLAGHQHAVIVVFLVIKGLNVLEDSQYLINIEIGVNFVVIIVYKVGDLYTP